MRKTLTQTLLAALCAILHAPLEGGGVMSIAGRNAMLAGGGGWKNPYVTDGLIAMWDGEWNAGGGKHDAGATVWKDCVNGWEFTPTGVIGDTVVFGDNKVTLSGGASYLRRGSLGVKPIIQGEGANAYFTIELCNTPVSNIKDKNFAHYFSVGTTIGNHGYGVRFYAAEGVAVRYLYVKNSLSTFSTQLTTSMPWTLTIVSDGTATKTYRNGTFFNSSTHGSTTGWFDNWYIGGGSSSGVYWEGDVFQHRFYSRALTAAEIAANYAVDKARFNLA